MNRAQEIENLQRRIDQATAQHKNTSLLTARLCSLRMRQLNEENEMDDAVTVERKVHEIECAVDDLTSLAHTPGGGRALAVANLEGIERRLRHLRFDLQARFDLAQQAAE